MNRRPPQTEKRHMDPEKKMLAALRQYATLRDHPGGDSLVDQQRDEERE